MMVLKEMMKQHDKQLLDAAHVSTSTHWQRQRTKVLSHDGPAVKQCNKHTK
jgi:hypothetical protein